MSDFFGRRRHTHLTMGDPGLGAPGFALTSDAALRWGAGQGPQGLRDMARQDGPEADTQFYRTLLAQPAPWLPYGQGIAHQIRDYVIHVDTSEADVTVGQSTLRLLRVDLPVAFYALTAAVRKTDGAALPSSVQSSLDMFKLQITYVQTDNIQTRSGLGSALCGTAQWPRLFGGPALLFDKRANVNFNITPLYSAMEVDIVVYVCEVREQTIGRQQ